MSRIEKLLEYLKTADKDSFLQHALALEYIKVGNDEEARKLFNELLLREPTYVGSYYHLGKLLERVGDFDKALRIYTSGQHDRDRLGLDRGHRGVALHGDRALQARREADAGELKGDGRGENVAVGSGQHWRGDFYHVFGHPSIIAFPGF